MSGRHRAERRLELVQVVLAPALDALDDMKRRPIPSVIAESVAAARLRRRRLALQDLDARRPALRLGQRAQPRAALGDAAVVVAVDQVGGLERGHTPMLAVAPVGASAPPLRAGDLVGLSVHQRKLGRPRKPFDPRLLA